MPVSPAANSHTFQVTTPTDCEITMTRLFDAPRHLVFEAMTKPEHVRRWWGILDDGYSVPVCDIDLRVGGKWRFVGQGPKGQAPDFYGEYREIAPPDRLVYTEIFAPFPDVVSVVTADPHRGERQDAAHTCTANTPRRRCATWSRPAAWSAAPRSATTGSTTWRSRCRRIGEPATSSPSATDARPVAPGRPRSAASSRHHADATQAGAVRTTAARSGRASRAGRGPARAAASRW